MKKSPQQKFQVGDVVEASGRYLRKRGWEEMKFGIVADVEKVTDISDYTSKPSNGEFYVYYLDTFYVGVDESAIGSWLRLCKGMKNKKYCLDCECFGLCLKSTRYCQTGGKFNAKYCNECKCRFQCWTNRERVME